MSQFVSKEKHELQYSTSSKLERSGKVALAVQENVCVILSPSLAEAHGTRALKFVSKFAEVIKLNL